MSRLNNAGHFFQTEYVKHCTIGMVFRLMKSRSSLKETERKSHKAKNDLGDPIKLSSKVLAVVAHPHDESAVIVAESNGTIERVQLGKATDVG